ncbi:hypothetical protein [Hymenobacter arizonensis]|uniref:O-antigen ligase like membrane protein n=1 Tax=Hymenobacter arizonensis TaxID=1227077 RepID=A0A1I6BRP1_HYMAR|nr:hypothetical protein [Hymenobacter arizonensis]SFQ83606.1 hypothetical protein SAMN04515668_5002 [Hymenobacter arizonensis]
MIPDLRSTANRWEEANSRRPIAAVDTKAQWLKRAVWAYFFLLIFEGALRKWVLPSLATPLLIIRDPIALWAVVVTWRRGIIAPNIYLTGMVVIAVSSIITATLLGHGNLFVALYGARIFLLHFPLIFVIGRVFTREDVISMGKVTLWIAIPMVLLVAMQFFSPQSAWVNQGIGGSEGEGFMGAMGFFRPPGTFSFTSGNASFFSFVALFVFYFWLDNKAINKLFLAAATAALLLSVPLSISRTLLFQIVISLVFVLIASARKPENLGRMLVTVAGGILVLSLLGQSSFFSTATEAFTSRFEDANEIEGGLEGVFLDRFLGGLIGALTGSASGLPFFGYGIGMGTNVGSMLLTGTTVFLISEGEWGRVIGELGPLLGLAVVFLRLGLAAEISWACYKKLTQGDLLPWLLLSFGLLSLVQGGWAQPTSLGFCTLTGGLMIASLRSLKQT